MGVLCNKFDVRINWGARSGNIAIRQTRSGLTGPKCCKRSISRPRLATRTSNPDEDEVDRSYLLRPGVLLGTGQAALDPLFHPRWFRSWWSGLAIAALWPATYLSEGKILVQSQQIPTELVRPTVTNAAQERIQVIEQRMMTRENLLAIVDKFQLFPTKRS